MAIVENLVKIKNTLPLHVQLVAVSKFHPDEAISEAYSEGQRIFGESKVQELVGKHERLPKDIHWHFIGHLQTNKVKYIAPFVEMIHAVDSTNLLLEIQKQAAKNDRTINCFFQVHIAREDSKFGFSSDEILQFLNSTKLQDFPNVRICGLMGMATFTNDTAQIRSEFKFLKDLFLKIKNQFFYDENSFCHLSMGMSDDYQIAVEEGSTLVRIGSSIFGNRIY